MRKLSTHAEWLRLVEISGPFISTTMLERAFPQGLESIDTPRRQRLRSAYEEWRDAVDENDPQLIELHREWVRLVLEDILDYDREVLVGRDDFGSAYVCRAPECAVNFVPDLAIIAAGDERPRIFISIHPPDMDLEKVLVNDGWPVPLVERMTLLCRTSGVRLGLVTNGERWMLVNAPEGSTSSHISWYSRLWFQEPVTLKAFLSLLGVRRCFGPAEETIGALLDESLKHNEEVTDTLGEQVRRAVEVLVQCLDKADQDRNRELLQDVTPSELYEAGLTIMMRLVFVLCAEERGLLLLDDPVYDQNYAISTLRSQLTEDADRHGHEVLNRRHDAWARLLAVFRAIYGGIEHEALRIPALGGSLFDPDRFPFLEGRIKGTKWRESSAAPLPIDNRTVLLLLEALQVLEQSGGALLLSYKALDVENIGHVYEGLLEHTVARVSEVTLGLVGSQNAKNPNVALRELEETLSSSSTALQSLLENITKRSESAIRNGLSKSIDDGLVSRMLSVCGGDTELTQRILPFANLLRTDAWNDPIVYRANSFTVTIGANRRDTGTHYTPKSLTETIVKTTLEPIVYFGPAEGKARVDWKLKTPEEILDLKVCDPAMGSGAFLVQVCRYLSQRLVESWGEQEAVGRFATTDGEVVDRLSDHDPLPTDLEDRLMVAKRLIAERCIYGIDLNPMAVELGKLSIWLITMAKGYPFGFLDHNLKCGDSLLGIHDIDQLIELRLKPSGERQQRLFGQSIQVAVNKALELRQHMRKMPLRDIHDVEEMARMDGEVHRELDLTGRIADCFIGSIFAANNPRDINNCLQQLSINADSALQGNADAKSALIHGACRDLSKEATDGRPRRPFHWPLEFPEAFLSNRQGFDAIVGNPPFMGGTLISGRLGKAYQQFISDLYTGHIENGGRGDFCAYFFLRASYLLSFGGSFGLIGTKTIGEGDTKEIGLAELERNSFSLYSAIVDIRWPGKASVNVSLICHRKGAWNGARYLDNNNVDFISASLGMNKHESYSPMPLTENIGMASEGVRTIGMGFVIDHEEAKYLRDIYPLNREVVLPFVDGRDINSNPDQSPSRWAINFFNWPEDRARTYKACWEIIETRVKPERQRLKPDGSYQLRAPMPQKYWQFGDPRMAFREQSKNLEKILVIVQTTKFITASFQDNDRIFSQSLVMIATNDYGKFAVINSWIHSEWIYMTCSSMGATQRYIVSDGFNTFPFPLIADGLRSIGEKYDSERKLAMTNLGMGLTELYNNVNDPSSCTDTVVSIRNLQMELDVAVIEAYGWKDLDLGYSFHDVPYLPENDRLRFAMSNSTRTEILRRLTLLNKERHEQEVEKGLHSSKTKPSSGKAKKFKSTDSQLAFKL